MQREPALRTVKTTIRCRQHGKPSSEGTEAALAGFIADEIGLFVGLLQRLNGNLDHLVAELAD